MVADAPTGGQTGNHDEMVGCRSSIRSSTKLVLEEHLKIFSRLSSCLCLPVGSKLKRKKINLTAVAKCHCLLCSHEREVDTPSRDRLDRHT